MSNGSYFSQYESPNIVIVPTMSLSIPSSPKRRKIGNNINVPIVNDETCEKQNIDVKQDIEKSEDLNAAQKADKNESSSKTASPKSSWASNYLQSIGLDNKSSIWNRKIPRKNASQKSVISVEPCKDIITAEGTSNTKCVQKTDIDKSDQLKIPNKVVRNSNKLKDGNPKIKQTIETKKRNIKDKSKHESAKVKCKNKIFRNDQSKIKTSNTKKDELNEQTVKLSTSCRHSIHKKTENGMNKTSHEGLKSKTSSKHSTVKNIHNKVEISNKKYVSVKQNRVQKDTKCNDKSSNRQNQRKIDSARLTANNLDDLYKEKHSNPESSRRDVTSTKNVKVTKKYDISDLNKLSITKKAQYNNELNTRVVRNKRDIRNIIKSNDKLTHNKSDLKLNQKCIKSPIKRNVPKTKSCRKIKLVINLICNSNSNPPNESFSNVSNTCSTTCTVPNVDLDFLNDFNIDEIVESLDSCEKKSSQYVHSDREYNKNKENLDKHSLKSNIYTGCNKNAQNDAIDLIKILKGEEDDDITRISIENAKDILFSNNLDLTQGIGNPRVLNDISKNGKTTKNFSTIPVKISDVEIKTSSSNLKCDPDNVRKITNVVPKQTENTCNINTKESVNEIENIKETGTVLRKSKELKLDNTQSPYSVKSETNSLETLPTELVDIDNKNTIKVEEQIVNAYNDNIDSANNIAFNNTKKDFHEATVKNINQGKCEFVIDKSIDKTKFTNLGNNQTNIISPDNLYNVDQKNYKDTAIQKSQKAANIGKVIEIADNKNYNDNSKIIKTEIPNTVIANSDNKSKQDGNTVHIKHNQRLARLNNDFQKYTEKQNESKASYNDVNSIKETIEVKSSDNINYNKPHHQNNFIDQNNFSLYNNKDVNVEKNTGGQEKIALIDNIIKEEPKRPGEIDQKDKHGSDKEISNVKNHFEKNKEKDLLDNETKEKPQRTISNNDDTIRGNIKSKADLETILKLEQQLFTCSGSRYSIISIIHTGRYSKLFKCKHPNGKYYALKMPTTNIKYILGKEKKQMLTTLIRDIPKNNLFIVYLAKAFNMADKWCFLMEYYPKNLDQALSEAGKPFSIEHIQDYARQLVMAVMVLRNNNMVHLDIKPKHILINSTNTILKLCGFDNLCYINKMRVLPNIGTVNYRAPEVILGYESGFEIDVWSTGLVLYEMAANRKLFPGAFNNDILYKQMCTLGCVPYDMIKKSRFSNVHFVGSRFMKRSGFKGQNVNLISKFHKNNKLCDSIYDAYFEHWGYHKSVSQQNGDIGKLSLFVKLLQKMLTVHPESRLPIEFVYANPFIYDAYSYQEW